MKPAIVIMAKAPVAGLVKTRLAPPLSSGEAAELAGCFLRDVAHRARRVCPALFVAYDPAGEWPSLQCLLPRDARPLVQKGPDLGARQAHALTAAAAQGFGPLVVIGTDSPTFPTVYLTRTLARLEQNDFDLVVGPAADGGYYLLGIGKPVASLFEGISWSTGTVCERLLKNAELLGLRVKLLPTWYDVDTPADLQRLRQELASDPGARRRAPTTAAWLAQHASQA